MRLRGLGLERGRGVAGAECEASIAKKKNPKQQRADIEKIINELAELSPIQNTAVSPQLQKPWLLLWTTEKEINIFNDWGISNGNITQIISQNGDESRLLQSNIPFQNGGGLCVEGDLSFASPDESKEQRTYFEFTSASLDIGKWGRYEAPPIGKGWFDTVYLDNDLRVDLNSRDDILICAPL